MTLEIELVAGNRDSISETISGNTATHKSWFTKSREIGINMDTSAQQDTPKQVYKTPSLEIHGTLTNIIGSVPCIDLSVPPDGDCD